MRVDERPTLLAIQHAPWEGPHRILEACGGLRPRTVKPLAGQGLAAHEEVAGAVVMGGPMNVDEVGRFPALAAEREWLAEALARDLVRRTAPGFEAVAALVADRAVPWLRVPQRRNHEPSARGR